MSEQFTPGPWATSNGHPRRVTATGKMICTAVLRNQGTCQSLKNCKGENEAEANAHLIAAAPDGYAVVAAIREAGIPLPEWAQIKADAFLAKASPDNVGVAS